MPGLRLDWNMLAQTGIYREVGAECFSLSLISEACFSLRCDRPPTA